MKLSTFCLIAAAAFLACCFTGAAWHIHEQHERFHACIKTLQRAPTLENYQNHVRSICQRRYGQ